MTCEGLLALGVQVHKYIARAQKVPICAYLEKQFRELGFVRFPHTQQLPHYR